MSKSSVPLGTKVRVRPDSVYAHDGRAVAGDVLETVGNDVEGVIYMCDCADEFTVLIAGQPAYGWVGDASADKGGYGFDPDFEVVE
jgi:hypothetical protein